MNNRLRPLWPSFIIYIVVMIISVLLRENDMFPEVDFDILMYGTTIVFLVSVFSFLLLSNSLRSSNPQVFVRAMYGSFVLRFFVIAIAAFIYIMVAKKDVNKPALFASLGLYFIFMLIEISVLTRLMRTKKHG